MRESVVSTTISCLDAALSIACSAYNGADIPSMPHFSRVSSYKRPSPHLTIGIRPRTIEKAVLSAGNHVHPRCRFREFPPLGVENSVTTVETDPGTRRENIPGYEYDKPTSRAESRGDSECIGRL